jgi:hypothetical protein
MAPTIQRNISISTGDYARNIHVVWRSNYIAMTVAPTFTGSDLFLWGYINESAHRNSPRNLDELKTYIHIQHQCRYFAYGAAGRV